MKKVIFLLISFLIISNMIPEANIFASIKKIDPVFLASNINIHKRIPVIVELNSEPVVTYSEKIYKLNNYYRPLEFNFDHLDKSYEHNLIQSQDQFLKWLDNNNIDYVFKYRCTNVLNSISIDVIPNNIQKIINNPYVKYIHDDSTIFYPTRAIASVTTGAKNVWNGNKTSKATGKKILVGIIQ